MAGLCLDEPAAELFGWPVTLAEVVAAPAGLELAAVLASVGNPAGLDDADLVEVLAELAARRPPVSGEPVGNVPGVSRFAGDEAALALGVSRVTGESRLRDAVLPAADRAAVAEFVLARCAGRRRGRCVGGAAGGAGGGSAGGRAAERAVATRGVSRWDPGRDERAVCRLARRTRRRCGTP